MLARKLSLPTRLERYRSALRAAAIAAGAVLVAFHGWVFAGQIADGRLADPWLVFRWIAAAGLALPETAVTSVLRLVVSAAAGLGLWLLAAMFAGRRRQVSHAFDRPLAFAAPGILADGFSPAYSSRPPPQKS